MLEVTFTTYFLDLRLKLERKFIVNYPKFTIIVFFVPRAAKGRRVPAWLKRCEDKNRLASNAYKRVGLAYSSLRHVVPTPHTSITRREGSHHPGGVGG